MFWPTAPVDIPADNQGELPDVWAEEASTSLQLHPPSDHSHTKNPEKEPSLAECSQPIDPRDIVTKWYCFKPLSFLVNSFSSNSLTGTGDQPWVLSPWDKIWKPIFHEILKHRGPLASCYTWRMRRVTSGGNCCEIKFLLWPWGVGQRLARWGREKCQQWLGSFYLEQLSSVAAGAEIEWEERKRTSRLGGRWWDLFWTQSCICKVSSINTRTCW